MEKFNYYQLELNKVNTKSEYPPTIKINSITGNTKNLTLNKESAEILINWLQINFINK